eukprot:scaffold71255_cov23-Tisochrysis_lutea.AAC.5
MESMSGAWCCMVLQLTDIKDMRVRGASMGCCKDHEGQTKGKCGEESLLSPWYEQANSSALAPACGCPGACKCGVYPA